MGGGTLGKVLLSLASQEKASLTAQYPLVILKRVLATFLQGSLFLFEKTISPPQQ
jgi:hypothetical protein